MNKKQLQYLFRIWLKIRDDWSSFDSFKSTMKESKGALKKRDKSKPHSPENSYLYTKDLPSGITRRDGKFAANIHLNGKQRWLGFHNSLESASLALDKAKEIRDTGIYNSDTFTRQRSLPVGVHLQNNKYRAYIRVPAFGTQVWLGDYKTAETASQVVSSAMVKRDSGNHAPIFEANEWRTLALHNKT